MRRRGPRLSARKPGCISPDRFQLLWQPAILWSGPQDRDIPPCRKAPCHGTCWYSPRWSCCSIHLWPWESASSCHNPRDCRHSPLTTVCRRDLIGSPHIPPPALQWGMRVSPSLSRRYCRRDSGRDSIPPRRALSYF